MKIIVLHMSPDLDAIAAAWIIQRFLPGWNEASWRFVPAGERMPDFNNTSKAIETNGKDDVIHVDTGLGPLDHHQSNSIEISAASLAWDYAKREYLKKNPEVVKNDKWKYKREAVERMIKVIVDIDHFQDIFWENPTSDYYDFNLVNILDGLKIEKPNRDKYYVEFGFECLDALLHEFENKIWAQDEIKTKGVEFDTRFGKGIGIETINDTTVKLGQKMGYVIVARKDPRKGYVRIKSWPSQNKIKIKDKKDTDQLEETGNKVDLTQAYEELRKMDPDATWYLHVSKKMLLNNSAKARNAKATRLKLSDIIEVLKTI